MNPGEMLMKLHVVPSAVVVAFLVHAPNTSSAIPATRPAASAQPSADASAKTPAMGAKPRFDAEPLPGEESKKPSAAEWKSATEVVATRAGPRAKGCTLWRVREWIRVSCPDLVTASLAFLGGTSKDVAFWIDPPREADQKLPQGGEVMFPVRKGDRRVLQFLTFGPGYEGPFTQLPALVVQEHWLADAVGPTIVLH